MLAEGSGKKGPFLLSSKKKSELAKWSFRSEGEGENLEIDLGKVLF